MRLCSIAELTAVQAAAAVERRRGGLPSVIDDLPVVVLCEPNS